MTKKRDLVDILEHGKLGPEKPKRSGSVDFDSLDNTPPSQWDEIGVPNILTDDDITEPEIDALLKEARLKLIKQVHERRKARKAKS